MNYKLIDTHCHLDLIELQGQTISESLEKAKNAGVEKIVQIGINLERSLIAKKIATEQNSEIDITYTIGCHPADNIQSEEVAQITKFIYENHADPKFVGIGEIGLDFFHKQESEEEQSKKFRHFLEQSIELNVPVVIHSRDAAKETFDILNEYKGKAFGVIHCFTYDEEYAKKYSDLGYYISFSGILAFKNAKDIHEAARSIPIDSILIETDAPYLTPPPNRGKRNDSSNMVFILEKMFSLRNESNAQVEEILYKNSEKFILRKRIEE